MHVFVDIAHALVLDKKTNKLDAKEIKCVFLEYFESMKVYRLMCLETKKIINIKNIIFMEDSESIRNDLEIHMSGRNEGPTMVVVNEYSKSPLCDDSGHFMDGNEQVDGNGVA